MVSASSSRGPRASQNPTLDLPRFTHVAGKNGGSIPIGKASKQELVAGLELYSKRHGEYPDNYPGGPGDISDSDNESSGDELDVVQDPKTPAHAKRLPPPSQTLPTVPDSQPPSKKRRYNPSAHSDDSDSRLSTPAHRRRLPSAFPQQAQVSQQLLDEEFQRDRERKEELHQRELQQHQLEVQRKEELHQLEVQERKARLQAAADERAAAATTQPPPRMTALTDKGGEATLTEPLTFEAPASFQGNVNAPDNLYAKLLWNGLAADTRRRYQVPIKSSLNIDSCFWLRLPSPSSGKT
jgi:hypothetical protein